MMKPASRATPHEVRTLAVDSFRDPRTVRRVLAGLPSKAIARTAVLGAVQRRGWEHLLETAPGNDSTGPQAA